MNLKGITAPLAEKINELVILLDKLLENIEVQTELLQKMNYQMVNLNEKADRIIEAYRKNNS
jgi:hypothetical protein|tara:strand:- start:7634 stop:7819 length:186 start_codon:yes stop_codon:yes gene_type:complete